MTQRRIVGELSQPNNLKYLEWKIPNFSNWFNYSHLPRFLVSPTFTFGNNSWHISLRPYGDLSLFLINETRRPENINFSFGVKESNGTLHAYRAKNATVKNRSGFTYFFKAGFLENSSFPSDILIITCILTPGENGQQVFNYAAPKADINTLSGIVVGKLNEPSNLKNLEWKIPNFSHWSDYTYPERCLISPNFIFESTFWRISLCPCDDPSVFLINETESPRNITFSFSVKESKGKLLAYHTNNATIKDKSGFTGFLRRRFLVEDCLFPSDTFTIVCILKPGKNVKEVFNYTPPKADKCTLKSEVESLKLMKLTETDVLSKNLKYLFTSKDYCDTVLRVKYMDFYAHRIILMARSSVFAAMFQHDTAEKRTGIVNIPDCDVNTFQEFLEYLYSGKLEDVSFDSAFQLYSTSEKYNVQELKMFCTKCMMQNLTVQNICDVVILADKYDEAMLYSAAQEFFNGNLKEILKMSEWESFLKINYRLANKLLIGMSESKVVQC